MAGSLSRAMVGLSALAAGLLPVASASAAQALIDFGLGTQTTTTDAVNRTWNNVNDTNDLSASPFVLQAANNVDSGYRLTVSNPPTGVTDAIGFNGSNNNGTQTPTGTAAARNYPASATRDSLYGNSTTFGSGIVQAVRLTFSNLNPAETYSFDFFASRTAAGGDNRETEYFITGGPLGTAPTSVLLNASENAGNVAGATGFRPDANNSIVIDVDRGPNNNNASGFYYLGVLELNSAPVPEPAGVGLLVAAAAAGLLRRRRRVR